MTETASSYGRLARDGAYNYGGQLLAGLAGLALVPMLLHRLGSEGYGVLLLGLTASTLMSFLDLGLGSVITREAAAREGDREAFLRSAFAALLMFGVVGGALIGLAGAIGHHLGLAPATADTSVVFVLVGIGFIGDQIAVYCFGVLIGLRRFGVTNAVLVASAITRVAGTFGLLRSGRGLAAVAAWYALCAWIWGVASGMILRRVDGLLVRPLWPRLAVLRPRLRYGAGSFGLMVGFAALWGAGPLAMAATRNAAASALFQVAQRIPLALQALPERVSVTLFPAAGELDRDDLRGARDLVIRGNRLIGLVVAPAVVILLVAPEVVLRLWLGSVPNAAPAIVRLTTLAVVAQALSASSLQVLWGRGDLRRLVPGIGAAALTGTILTILLTPALGGLGSAIGLLVGQAGLAVWIVRSTALDLQTTPFVLLEPTLRMALRPVLIAGALALVAARIGAGRWPAAMLVGVSVAVGYAVAVLASVARSPTTSAGRRFISGALARMPRLRSAIYFVLHLRVMVEASPRRRARAAVQPYEQAADPWGYDGPWGSHHFEVAERLLDSVISQRCAQGLDVGCGEGWGTTLLLNRCDQVLGVDISPLALGRARARHAPHADFVRFEKRDVAEGLPVGQFELVLAMGLLETFERPRSMRRILDVVINATAVGGYLLVTTTKQAPIVEQARWATPLRRGSRAMVHLLRAQPGLELCEEAETETHHFSLLRRHTGLDLASSPSS
jgi:O-antigen/teichoic acid export membrane protein/SAM-dependent methyltransferase